MAIAAQHTRFVTNDYVSPIPAEDLIKVAIKKQEMYDEGRKQIKQAYDNYGKLRSMIKNENELNYYDQEMQKIHKNVQQNAGLDFSNIGNVEAVINLAKPFENDEYIKTALENGQEIDRRSKELASMPKDKRSLDNDLVYMYDAQKHMESGGLGQKIAKNKSYQQFVDIRAKIIEAEKQVPAEEFTDPTMYEGPGGYLKQIEHKRKRREDIYRRAMEGMTPEEQAQLQIHAQANMLRLGSDVIYQNWVGYNKEEKLLAEQKRKETLRALSLLQSVKKPTADQADKIKILNSAMQSYESVINAANENINMNPDDFDMGEYLPFFTKRQIDGIAGQLAFSNTKTELKENRVYMAQLNHNLRVQEIAAQGREQRQTAQFKEDLENYQVQAGATLTNLQRIESYVKNIDATQPPAQQVQEMIRQIEALDPTNSKSKITAQQKRLYIDDLKQLKDLLSTATNSQDFDKVSFNRSAGLGQVQTSVTDLLGTPVINIIKSGKTLDLMRRVTSEKKGSLTAQEKAYKQLEEKIANEQLLNPGMERAQADSAVRQRERIKLNALGNPTTGSNNNQFAPK
jgi:hypothetical protein